MSTVKKCKRCLVEKECFSSGMCEQCGYYSRLKASYHLLIEDMGKSGADLDLIMAVSAHMKARLRELARV